MKSISSSIIVLAAVLLFLGGSSIPNRYEGISHGAALLLFLLGLSMWIAAVINEK